jgi:cellulose synthase/poly-beta-1,6-N-acetylglucosamine synthase-like glycosyltransferase
MISILITAYKEPLTVGKCIRTILNTDNGGLQIEYELLLGCPDTETLNAALKMVKELGVESNFRHIQDEGKGKPAALTQMMNEAKGDIWFFGDGDTYFGPGVVAKMLTHFINPEVMAVTGRPRSADGRDNMMGYFGHLLSDAANHKRKVDLTDIPQGKSARFVRRRKFFPVSGYLFAMRRNDIRPPSDCLVEDAYISYEIYNRGGKIEYEPEAEVYVKYASTLQDYFKQKNRSAGGYIQLWQYGVVKPETKSRSFWRELEYFWFPLTYAKNIREFIWSLMLYPIRLWMWLMIYYERKIIKKDFVKTWVRVESTK